MTKISMDAKALFEQMALNSYHWETIGNNSRGIMDDNGEMMIAILAKMIKFLNNKFDKLSSMMIPSTCESCFLRGHEEKDCKMPIEDQVHAMYTRESLLLISNSQFQPSS